MSLNSFVQLCLFSQNKCLGSEWSFKTICLKLSAETLPHCALGPHSLEEQSGGPHTHTLGHVWSPVTVCHWTTGHCSSALPMTAKYVMRPIKANWFCNTEPSQDSWMFLNILQFSLSGPRDWRKSVLAAFTNPEETGMEDRIMCSSGVFLALSGQFYKKKKKKWLPQSLGGLMGQQATKKDPMFPVLVPNKPHEDVCLCQGQCSQLCICESLWSDSESQGSGHRGKCFSLGAEELIFGKRKCTLCIN